MARGPLLSRARFIRLPPSGRIVVAVLSVLAFAAALAAAPPPSLRPAIAPAAESVAVEHADLEFANRPIATFRASLGAANPAERAQGALRKIEEIARSGAAAEVTTQAIPEGVLVSAGSRAVFTITPGDSDALFGETPEELASIAAARLREALAEAREMRRPGAILSAVIQTVVATLLFLLAVRLILAVRKRLLARASRLVPETSRGLVVAGFSLVRGRQLASWTRWSISAISWAVGLLLVYPWLTFVLTRYPYSRPWGEALGGYVVETLRGLGIGALHAVPGLFAVALVFLVARFIVRTLDGFFASVEAGEIQLGWLPAETAMPTRRLAVALVWVLALVVAYPRFPGSSTDAFKGISVFLGIMISLGSAGFVNQVMSGLALMYSRALRPGDVVKIGDHVGRVLQLGTFSTKLTTYRGEEVTIPNAVVIGSPTRNYSSLARATGPVLHTEVTIGYDAPWRQVHAMLLRAAERTPGLRREPAPLVLQTSLADFYVVYELIARLESPETWAASLNALHGNIQDEFNEHGVQIMSPHFMGQPQQNVVVPKARWFEPPAGREGA
jgi:small-conductance mechanosensitive channel